MEEVILVVNYTTTVQRKASDIATKVIKTSGGIILMVTQAVMENLRFDKLWERCQTPIPIVASRTSC